MTLHPDDMARLEAAGLRLDGLAIYSGETPVARLQGTGDPATTEVIAIGGRPRFLPFFKLPNDVTKSAVQRFCEARRCA